MASAPASAWVASTQPSQGAVRRVKPWATLAWGLLRGGPPALQPKTALVLDLAGRISEQRPASSRNTVLRQLQGEGMSILLVEQNLKFARRVADRHVVVENGKVVDQLDAADTLEQRVAAELALLTSQGVACYLLHGNRDFLLGAGYAGRCGASLLADPAIAEHLRNASMQQVELEQSRGAQPVH